MKMYVSCCPTSPFNPIAREKGIAEVRLSDGEIVRAEIHWYEATGIGRKEFKVKHIL